MNDEELATELRNAFWKIFSPSSPKDAWNGMPAIERGGWLAVLSHARALLAAERVGLPTREDAAKALYDLYFATKYNGVKLNRWQEEDWMAVADLALSWHAPEPMEQDVEKLARQLEKLRDPSRLCVDLRVAAQWIITHYGAPCETLKPIHQEELHDWLNVLPDAVMERADTRQLARLIAERYCTLPEVRKPTEREALLQDANLKLSRDNTALTAENARLRSALEEVREFVKPNGTGPTVVMRKDVLATIAAALAPSPAEAKGAEALKPDLCWILAGEAVPDGYEAVPPAMVSTNGRKMLLCKRRAGGGL